MNLTMSGVSCSRIGFKPNQHSAKPAFGGIVFHLHPSMSVIPRAGSLHGGSYPDTVAFLRRLSALDAEAAGRSNPGAADLEAARGLFNWQVLPRAKHWPSCAPPNKACLILSSCAHHKQRGSVQEEVVVSRAPGRLDVFGGIADYSGSLVLQLPLAEACHVAVQRTLPAPGERRCCLAHGTTSRNPSANEKERYSV